MKISLGLKPWKLKVYEPQMDSMLRQTDSKMRKMEKFASFMTFHFRCLEHFSSSPLAFHSEKWFRDFPKSQLKIIFFLKCNAKENISMMNQKTEPLNILFIFVVESFSFIFHFHHLHFMLRKQFLVNAQIDGMICTFGEKLWADKSKIKLDVIFENLLRVKSP